jgi:hypothetical protein
MSGEFDGLSMALGLTAGKLVLCALAGWQLGRLWPSVKGTTLIDAWFWAWLVVLAATAVTACSWDGRVFAAGDCLVAIAGLTPLVAVLGARRPTNRVWTPFVMLPLIVVLYWPVLSIVVSRGWRTNFAMELPAVAGFGLVAVMACGNFLGTRLTFVALAWGLVLTALFLCYAAVPRYWVPPVVPQIAMGLVGVFGLWRAEQVWNQSGSGADRFDRVWFDVFDRFGVVWARRLQDRLNAIARQHAWPGQLELDGWHWRQPPSVEQTQQVEHACRWLLRRFVNAAWIDQRLGPSTLPATTLSVDS